MCLQFMTQTGKGVLGSILAWVHSLTKITIERLGPKSYLDLIMWNTAEQTLNIHDASSFVKLVENL